MLKLLKPTSNHLVSFVFFFICFHVFMFSCFHGVFAADEFSVAYDVTYEVQENGDAKAIADIALTNKLSNVYATRYSLVVEKGEISKIGAWDSQGEIKTEIEDMGSQTKITLNLNDQIVGVDKTLRFTLKYEITNLAKKTGQTWQIILPQQADLNDLDSYNLTLKVPKSFPGLAMISPEPSWTDNTRNFYQYFFGKANLQKKGIIAIFGEFQVFDFKLNYHLINPKPIPAYTKIALPPTTASQKVAYSLIEPKPDNVEVDGDGNWLATYFLLPAEKKDIVAQGQAQIYTKPAEKQDFASGDLDQYLLPQPFWETENPEIQRLADRLKTPKAIYNFVIQTLDYDFEKVKTGQKRMGGVKALEDPTSAICMEFTDLFISLARAAGIPARELNGFAYTNNPKLKPLSESADILHAWPEYWDAEKEIWVQIDPTWEETSEIDYFGEFDLSHFVFAIHGADSQYPAAAGSYRDDTKRQKDIEIDFGVFQEEQASLLKVEFILPQSFFGEKGVIGKIILENTGAGALYRLPVKIKTTNLKLKEPETLTISALPPFGKKEIPIEINGQWLTRRQKAKIELLANHQSFSYNVIIDSLILELVLPALGGVVIGSSLLIFILRPALRGKNQSRTQKETPSLRAGGGFIVKSKKH